MESKLHFIAICFIVLVISGFLLVNFFYVDNQNSSDIEENQFQVPELTSEEKQKVEEIALSNPIVESLIEGEEYSIWRIGVWQEYESEHKIGGSVVITFGNAKRIDNKIPVIKNSKECPPFEVEKREVSEKVNRIAVQVSLDKEKVIEIIPI